MHTVLHEKQKRPNSVMFNGNTICYFFFTICTPYVCQAYSSESRETKETWNITAEMIKADIIPKLLPKGPEQFLEIFLQHGRLKPGDILLHDKVISKPGIVFEADNTTWNSLFIVVKENWDPEEKLASRSYNMTTPRPSRTEWHELIIMNIPGNDYFSGRTVLDFDPPQHDTSQEIVDLFLFLVYRQPDKFEIKKKVEMITRNGTVLATLADYVKHYNLIGPIAGNFVYRRWCHPAGYHTPRYPLFNL